MLKFHRKLRLNVVAIAAGMTHSMALTEDGALFYWSSADPELQCHQVLLYSRRFFFTIHHVNYWIFLLNNWCTSSVQLHSLCGKGIAGISAGKYWTAAVTMTGDTYMWDGKKGKDAPPSPTRLHGVKKATSVSVGETHLLIISSLYHPCHLPQIVGNKKPNVQGESDELCEGFMFDDVEHEDIMSHMQTDDSEIQALPISGIPCEKSAPSLKSLCESVAAEHLVDPRNAIQLLEIADSLGADDLKRHCEVWFRLSCY